eukprot:SAG31_NODE_4292_length_3375_cov_9.381868_3_plen_270_part_00
MISTAARVCKHCALDGTHFRRQRHRRRHHSHSRRLAQQHSKYVQAPLSRGLFDRFPHLTAMCWSIWSIQILGISFKLPPNIVKMGGVWDCLVRGDSAISNPRPGFKGMPAGYLAPPFDKNAAQAAARSSGVTGAEGMAMDPQHALALSLASELWVDAGPEAASLAKADLNRIGEDTVCISYILCPHSTINPCLVFIRRLHRRVARKLRRSALHIRRAWNIAFSARCKSCKLLRHHRAAPARQRQPDELCLSLLAVRRLLWKRLPQPAPR